MRLLQLPDQMRELGQKIATRSRQQYFPSVTHSRQSVCVSHNLSDTKDAAFTDGNEDKASPELKYGTSFAAEGVDQSAIEVDYTEICFTPGVETSDLQIYTWDILVHWST